MLSLCVGCLLLWCVVKCCLSLFVVLFVPMCWLYVVDVSLCVVVCFFCNFVGCCLLSFVVGVCHYGLSLLVARCCYVLCVVVCCCCLMFFVVWCWFMFGVAHSLLASFWV